MRAKRKNPPALCFDNSFKKDAYTIKFEAANANQKLALAHLRAGKQVVALIGSAGVGKSMLAAYWAASQYKAKQISEIILLRPNVLNGRTIGLLTGNEDDKLAPFFVQTKTHLAKFLGDATLKYCENKGVIKTKAFEYIRGYSFENALVIVEEGQGLTFDEFETLLTRIGEGSQLIITGDTRQVNKGFDSGMAATFEMIAKAADGEYNGVLAFDDILALKNSVGVVKFTPDDIVRSGFCKAMAKLYFYDVCKHGEKQ